jgi:hypothetical protein
MMPPRCRMAALAGSSMRLDDDSPMFVTVVIYAVTLADAEAAIRSRTASTRTAHLDHCDPYQLYRRVVVPAADLLREGLPQPQA